MKASFVLQVLAVIPLLSMGSMIAGAADEPTPAVPAAAAVAAPARKAAPTVGALTAKVVLTSTKELTGTLVSSTQLSMSSSVGPLDIPLSEVAGIKNASGDDTVTTVVLHNGDSFTGAIELDRVELETEWGKAEVIGPNIDHILFAQDLGWQSGTGFAGKRWNLVKAASSASISSRLNPPTQPAANTTVSQPAPTRTQPVSSSRVAPTRYYYTRPR